MLRVCLCAVVTLAGSLAGAGADWPQFRGPGGSGVATDTGLPLEWSATRNIVWKVALPGPGSSSPIVFGDRVYVTCYSGYGVGKTPGKLTDLKRHLVCIERGAGKILWLQTIAADAAAEPPYNHVDQHGYTSSTPVADASGVYVYFGSGGIAGYTHAGEQMWRVPGALKGKLRADGSCAASPILHGDLLIVVQDHVSHQADTVALDKANGREVWRHETRGTAVSPVLLQVGGKTELVVASGGRFRYEAFDPATGKPLWHCDAPMYAATASAHDGVLFVTGGDKRAAIKGGGQGNVTYTHKLWETAGGVVVPSPVLYDGHLYWCSDRADLAFCAAVRDKGRIVYRERLPEPEGTREPTVFASPVVADGRIYFVSRARGAFVIAASPKFEFLAHNRIADDDSAFNGSPAVSHGRLFLRSDKYLYCIGK